MANQPNQPNQPNQTDQFKCQVCGKKFSNEDELRRHARQDHPGIGQQPGPGQQPGSNPQR